MTTLDLPLPHLAEGRFASLSVFTDESLFEQTGIRIAFTTRAGGVSASPYESFNLGSHVDDDPGCVTENRMRLLNALADDRCSLIVPRQVHGDTIVEVDSASCDDLMRDQEAAAAGADAIIIRALDVAALLCFADCVPVIAVGPDRAVAVIHAGWRGVDNRICTKAITQMALRVCDDEKAVREYAALTNVYIGPYIHQECFEVSADLAGRFERSFGPSCRFDRRHINLGQALRTQLVQMGVDAKRIADLDMCTVCNTDTFFSYRAEGGVTGRHGAFAIKISQ